MGIQLVWAPRAGGQASKAGFPDPLHPPPPEAAPSLFFPLTYWWMPGTVPPVRAAPPTEEYSSIPLGMFVPALI